MRASVRVGLLSSGLLTTTAALGAFPDCPTDATPQALTDWRTGAIAAIGDPDAVSAAIAKCFPTTVPKCLERTQNIAAQNDTASATDDGKYDAVPQRHPPDELKIPGATGNLFTIPEDIEKIAAAKGWTSVRYKSRHAGGFDSSTPSLLMVYVPGDKVEPRVGFDRWLNFALPADDEANALNPIPQHRIPSPADYVNEANADADLPRTFTMVALDKAVDATPAKVYFQKFQRQNFGKNSFQPESTSSADSCYSCHPNGLRAISPLGFHVRAGEKAMPKDAWQAVSVINDAMEEGANSKQVSWREVPVQGGAPKPLLRQKSHWPVVGAGKPLNPVSRTKEFILGGTLPDGTTTAGCAKAFTGGGFDCPENSDCVRDIFGRPPGLNNVYTMSAQPKIDWEKVKTAMNCETCHNNKTRGAINTATNFDQISFKILVDQSMPLGAHTNPLDGGDETTPVKDDLTGDERLALNNCLAAELELERPLLAKYLAATTCGN